MPLARLPEFGTMLPGWSPEVAMRHRFRGIVRSRVEVVLEIFAVGAGGTEIAPAKSEIEREFPVYAPAILAEEFQLPEVERPIEAPVALAQRCVVSEQKVGQAVAAVVRVQNARAETEIRRIGPGRLLPVQVPVIQASELERV